MIVFRFVEQRGRWHWEATVDQGKGGETIAKGASRDTISEAEATLLLIIGASTESGAKVVVEHR